MGMFKGANFIKAYHNLSIGMARDEVISMFGQPNSRKIRGETEILGWWSREFKGLLRGGSIERRATVEFENGLVTGYDGENIDVSIW